MSEQEKNLPSIQFANNVATTQTKGLSLLARGLTALDMKAKQDADYRKASEVFYKYYSNTCKTVFDPNEAQELFNSYLRIKQLALSGYGKAFWIYHRFCISLWCIAPKIYNDDNAYLDFDENAYLNNDKNIYLDFKFPTPLFINVLHAKVFAVKAENWLIENRFVNNDSDIFFQLAIYVFSEADNREYWLKKSAEGNCIIAQKVLADYYDEMADSLPDERVQYLEQAKYWYDLAHCSGEPSATLGLARLYYLGKIFKHGESIKVNQEYALDLYLKAAQKGNVLARYHAGILLEKLHYGYDESEIQLQIAAYYGHPEARTQLGFLFFNAATDNYEIKNQKLFLRAFDYFERAAEEDDSVDAMKMLWSFYKDGLGVEPDTEKATYWLNEFLPLILD